MGRGLSIIKNPSAESLLDWQDSLEDKSAIFYLYNLKVPLWFKQAEMYQRIAQIFLFMII